MNKWNLFAYCFSVVITCAVMHYIYKQLHIPKPDATDVDSEKEINVPDLAGTP